MRCNYEDLYTIVKRVVDDKVINIIPKSSMIDLLCYVDKLHIKDKHNIYEIFGIYLFESGDIFERKNKINKYIDKINGYRRK